MSDSVSYQMSRPRRPKTWWIEKVPKRKKTFFANSLKDFLRNISLHGYGKMVEEKTGIGERIIWFVVHIMTLTVLIGFLQYTMSTIADNFYITLYDPLYPIEKVPFPTVSICSNNRISNASAWQYAVELSDVDPRNRDPVYFYGNIRMLAYLYKTNEAIDFDRAVFFQGFLDLFRTDDDDVFFNTHRVIFSEGNRVGAREVGGLFLLVCDAEVGNHFLKTHNPPQLTPKCGQMLRTCHLGGRKIDCINEFETSLTVYGFCCTFNRKDKYRERSENMSFYGPTQGLTVALKSNPNDSFYNIIDTEGFVVMVHSHNLYGDVAAGGVSETFISSQMESFIAIAPKVTDSVPSIRYYSPRLRSCYFENELPTIYGKSYSLNRCITRCRIRSIIVLCQCLPFYYPYHFLDTTTETVHCTLQHLECLNRYEFKWMNVITKRETVRGIEREMEDGLYCPECLPSCSDIQYKVSLMSLPLDRLRYVRGRTHNHTATDLTSLHLYFGEPTVPFYKQIIKNSAFEIFSTVGNICGVVTGFSLVAVCEILYFFGGEIIALLWHLFMVDHSKGDRKETKLIICP